MLRLVAYRDMRCRKCLAQLVRGQNWATCRAKRHDKQCDGCYRADQRARYVADREKRQEWQRTYIQKLRSDVLAAYGGACACCGETEPDFLTIDHVNNDGAAHRRALGTNSGHQVYRWLRDRGFPKEGFQLLCWNCNASKAHRGSCPHQRRAAQEAV